jgi:hypothetical protein
MAESSQVTTKKEPGVKKNGVSKKATQPYPASRTTSVITNRACLLLTTMDHGDIGFGSADRIG